MSNSTYFPNHGNNVSLRRNSDSNAPSDMANTIQVALLEDHSVFRSGLKLALAPTYHVALEAGTATDFFEKINHTHIDILLLDLLLPDLSGIEVARHIKETKSDIKILVLSIDTREDVLQQLVKIGIDGFLSKNTSEERLLEAIKTILHGEHYFECPEMMLERDVLIAGQTQPHEALTEREHDIMLAFCKGLSSTEIAAKMFISPRTVDNHKQHIFEKLGIHNVVELVTYAIKHKIIIIS